MGRSRGTAQYFAAIRSRLGLARGFGGGSVGLVIAEFDDPETAVDIVYVDISFVRIGSPSERKVGAIAFRIAGPEVRNFPALIV